MHIVAAVRLARNLYAEELRADAARHHHRGGGHLLLGRTCIRCNDVSTVALLGLNFDRSDRLLDGARLLRLRAHTSPLDVDSSRGRVEQLEGVDLLLLRDSLRRVFVFLRPERLGLLQDADITFLRATELAWAARIMRAVFVTHGPYSRQFGPRHRVLQRTAREHIDVLAYGRSARRLRECVRALLLQRQ